MVERFIFPEETKVCLKGLFPVTKQTSHNILSNKGFQQNKQTKLPKKRFVLESFKLVRWKFVSRFRFKNKGCGKKVCLRRENNSFRSKTLVSTEKTLVFNEVSSRANAYWQQTLVSTAETNLFLCRWMFVSYHETEVLQRGTFVFTGKQTLGCNPTGTHKVTVISRFLINPSNLQGIFLFYI